MKSRWIFSSPASPSSSSSPSSRSSALPNIPAPHSAFPFSPPLLVTLIPTTIGGLLSAIGIAGMDRLIRFNVVATSGRAVEAAGDVDALLLDKTGTITFGNRMAAGLYPTAKRGAKANLPKPPPTPALGDDTPEGRSIITYVRDRHGINLEMPPDANSYPLHSEHPCVRRGRIRIKPGAKAPSTASSNSKTSSLHRQLLSQSVDRVSRAGSTPLGRARQRSPPRPRSN